MNRDFVLSDVHVFTSATATKSKETKLNHSRRTTTTRFFFDLNEDADRPYKHSDSNDITRSKKQDDKKCISNFDYDEDGDVVMPQPDGKSLQGRINEVITIEHRLQTVLKDVGFQVWLGSLLLCDYLIANSDTLYHHSVLDLGAGTGLTSIIAAIFAKSVVCTDYTQEIVDLAEKNWKRNSELLSLRSKKQIATFQVLDWTNHQLHSDTGEDTKKLLDASLIIAAEVVYDDDLTDALFQTIYHLLKRPPSKTVIMSVEKRIVFDSAWRDVCSPAYLHFQENMNDLCTVDEGNVRFDCQQIPSESVRQYFLYDRTAQLAFQELSLKKAQAESQIRISNAQIEALQRKIQHSQLVGKEVLSFPEDTKMYKSIGRMFLLQDQSDIKEDLKKKQQSFADKIKSLESSKEYLERNIEECKNNVRELVMTKQHSR